MDRARVITAEIKKHDHKLFCRKNGEGKLCIYREGTVIDSYDISEFAGKPAIMHHARSSPHYVCALTDNWKPNGRPVDWGLMPIMKHLRFIDLWNRDIVSDLEKQSEAKEASNRRHLVNETEAFFSEKKGVFQKAFNDINTANMAKKDRRYIKDKSIKG